MLKVLLAGEGRGCSVRRRACRGCYHVRVPGSRRTTQAQRSYNDDTSTGALLRARLQQRSTAAYRRLIGNSPRRTAPLASELPEADHALPVAPGVVDSPQGTRSGCRPLMRARASSASCESPGRSTGARKRPGAFSRARALLILFSRPRDDRSGNS